jgi:hypothetical protein
VELGEITPTAERVEDDLAPESSWTNWARKEDGEKIQAVGHGGAGEKPPGPAPRDGDKEIKHGPAGKLGMD